MMFWGPWGWGGGWGAGLGVWGIVLAVLGMLVPFVFVGLIILAIIRLTRSSSVRYHEDSALAILRERYARGEITHEDYERMKKELS